MASKQSIAPRFSLVPMSAINDTDLMPLDDGVDITDIFDMMDLPDVTSYLQAAEGL